MFRRSFKIAAKAKRLYTLSNFEHKLNFEQNHNKPVMVKPGYCKAKIFMALYNRAKPTNMGVLEHVEGNFDAKQAWNCLEHHNGYLDYVNGRGMKLDFSDLHKDRTLYSRRYDARQQGPGTMVRRLEEMYATQSKCYDCKLQVCQSKTIRDRAIGEVVIDAPQGTKSCNFKWIVNV